LGILKFTLIHAIALAKKRRGQVPDMPANLNLNICLQTGISSSSSSSS